MGLTNNTGKLSNTLTSNGTQITLGGSTVTDSNLLNLIGNQSAVNVGIVFNNTNATFPKIYGIQNINNGLAFYDYSSNATRMTITTAGNVGIGTTSPSTKLTVYGGYANFTDGTVDIYSGSDGSGGLFGTISNHYQRFITNNTERMRITSGGDVGIGNSNSAGYKLLVTAKDNSSSNYALVVTNSSLSTLLYIRNDGYAWISQTAWAYGSDLRLKENINYIESGLDKILALKPTKFDYIDGAKDNIGWIAQDVQEVIPEAVLVNTNDERGYLSLKSDFIIPYLVKAVQEQQEIINQLSAKVTALENQS